MSSDYSLKCSGCGAVYSNGENGAGGWQALTWAAHAGALLVELERRVPEAAQSFLTIEVARRGIMLACYFVHEHARHGRGIEVWSDQRPEAPDEVVIPLLRVDMDVPQ